MKLLLVEDNHELQKLVAGHLVSAGFAIDRAGTLNQAREAMAMTSYDLLLLDLGLPAGEDGGDLLTDKDGAPLPPVIVLTARDAVPERIRLLNSGADDYLIKPFDLLELEARIHAVLRRPRLRDETLLTCGDLTLAPQNGDLQVNGVAMEASRRERALLEELLRHAGRTVVREALEDRLYSFDEAVTPNALEQIVSRLRRRLSRAGSTVTIDTKRGIGYRLSSPPYLS